MMKAKDANLAKLTLVAKRFGEAMGLRGSPPPAVRSV